jgi:four helix bundle protein
MVSGELQLFIIFKSVFMFLQLAHTKLNVYSISRTLALECYKVTKLFPNEEKFAIVQQIRRAALSVYLNIAEGCSWKSKIERLRYFEIARGSVIETDAAMDLAFNLDYVSIDQLQAAGDSIVKTFKLLTGMMKQNNIHN